MRVVSSWTCKGRPLNSVARLPQPQEAENGSKGILYAETVADDQRGERSIFGQKAYEEREDRSSVGEARKTRDELCVLDTCGFLWAVERFEPNPR